MVRSMTGFGCAEIVENNQKLTIEIKSVNHKYFDINIKAPKKLNRFESNVREFLKNYVIRGKIDLYVTYEDLSGTDVNLKYNESLAKEYIKNFELISQSLNIENDIKVSDLIKCPDVLSMKDCEADEEELWKLMEKAIVSACEMFIDTRSREGELLKIDLIEKLDEMDNLVNAIETKSPEINANYKKRLEDKLKEVLEDSQIDESRIATELVIFADRVCVDEEIVRLKSHIKNMRTDLYEGGELGRKLNFIAQEMNREANTILSKANNMYVANKAIALKTEIEKIREQIQNIE